MRFVRAGVILFLIATTIIIAMREHFIVLTFFDAYAEVAEVSAHFANKEIILKNITILPCNIRSEEEKRQLEEVFQHVRMHLKKTFLSAFYRGSPTLIVALNSKHALTRYENVSLARENSHKPIDDADLDNIISQAMWKTYEDGRRVAMEQLKLPEAEILFADTNVYDVIIDGKKIINPLQHTGKHIDICLSQTFVERNFFSRIVRVLSESVKAIAPIEGGVAATHLLSRMHERSNFVFAKTMEERTDLFLRTVGRASRSAFYDYFTWGTKGFFASLGKQLAVTPHVARSILSQFVRGEVSPSLHQKLKGILREETIVLLRGLRHASEENKSNAIFLDMPDFVGLPPEEIFPKIVQVIDVAAITNFFGFSVKTQSRFDFVTIASLLEFYFLPGENILNHLAKRRMRWLLPEGN